LLELGSEYFFPVSYLKMLRLNLQNLILLAVYEFKLTHIKGRTQTEGAENMVLRKI